MTPAPLPANESQRLAALHSYPLSNNRADKSFDAIVGLAANICEMPMAAIGLVDADRLWVKSAQGLPGLTDLPRDSAFCAHAILRQGLMMVPNATEDERFRDNPLVTGNPNIRFYAGMPLIDGDGFALGTLFVVDHRPRTLSLKQVAALADLARLVIAQLESRRSENAAPTSTNSISTNPISTDSTSSSLAKRVDDAQLQLLTKRLSLTQRAAQVGIWQWDMRTGELTWDAQMHALYGIDENTNISYSRWANMIVPEDVAQAEATLMRAIESQTASSTKFRIRHPSLGIRFIEATEEVVTDADGKPIAVVGVNQDVTQHKQFTASAHNGNDDQHVAGNAPHRNVVAAHKNPRQRAAEKLLAVVAGSIFSLVSFAILFGLFLSFYIQP